MIRKIGNEFCLYSKDGSKKLFCNASRKKVVDREKQILRIKHAKGEEMNVTEKNGSLIASTQNIGDAVWTTAYIDSLDDSAFAYIDKSKVTGKDEEGKSVPRSSRHLPIKNKSEEIDLPHLRTALAKVNQIKASAETKRGISSKLRFIAKDAGIDVSEEFLDDVELLGPLFPPYLEQTLMEFNEGMFGESFDAECYDYMGPKLARAMNRYSSSGFSERTYDDEGNIVSSTSDDTHQNEEEWEYQDGTVTKHFGVSKHSHDHEYERGTIGDDDGDDGGMDEADSFGKKLKSLRSKKKMSRYMMASKMKMTMSRLKEIEDGDEPDDDEMSEIAGALGMTVKNLRRLSSADAAAEEGNGMIAIVRNTIHIIRPKTFFREEMVDFEVRPGVWESIPRFGGFINEESIKQNGDGTVNFSVALFKYGKLTSNNNRYMEEFGTNLIKHLKRLDKKTSRINYKQEEIPGLTANDIAVLKVFDGQSLDMMATHRSRQGKGNPILERAGRILGAREDKLEGDKTLVILAKTINGSAGESVTAQILEGMINGVSLYAWPFEKAYEENDEGGHNVYNGLLVGADFTNEGGNLVQFRDKEFAAPMMN